MKWWIKVLFMIIGLLYILIVNFFFLGGFRCYKCTTPINSYIIADLPGVLLFLIGFLYLFERRKK